MLVSLNGFHRPARQCCRRVVILAIGLVVCAPSAWAQAPPGTKSVSLQPPRPAPATEAKPDSTSPETTLLSLHECFAVALERQPAVRAARAGLAAAEAGQRALHEIHPLSTVIARDLPVRREQAARGMLVATAEVRKAEAEVIHDVTFLYYGFVYARQQEQTATDVIDQLQVFYEIAKELIKSGPQGPRGLTQFTIYQMEEAISEVKRLRVDAQTGQRQALAALREAMGVEQCSAITPRDTELPVMGGTVTEAQVVLLAQSLRPELAQAAAGVDVFRLEVCAQDRVRYRQTVPTLASGSDLHARFIPGPSRNGEYRPGALAPEMPTSLVGKREDRVTRAYAISLRQDEVYAKTRDLVQLEAINAYLAWKAATEKMSLAKERSERSRRAARLGTENAQNANITFEVLVRNEALVGRAQSDYLTSVYDHIKALARLRRVTGGGVTPSFPGP